MSNENGLMNKERKATFSMKINSTAFQEAINRTLSDPAQAKRFCAAITAAVNVNPELQKCDAASIIGGALLGETLGLSPSPQLGQYYLVPRSRNDVMRAQLVIGYKGLLQLAIRSGAYKNIIVLLIKEGELQYWNPLEEELKATLIADPDERAETPTAGYYAKIVTQLGFEKAAYMTKKEMLSYADKYSPAFSKDAYEKIQKGEIADKDMRKYSSPWYTEFDKMGSKTMLRILLKTWAINTPQVQDALYNDNTISTIQDGTFVVDLNDDIEDETLPENTSQEVVLDEL